MPCIQWSPLYKVKQGFGLLEDWLDLLGFMHAEAMGAFTGQKTDLTCQYSSPAATQRGSHTCSTGVDWKRQALHVPFWHLARAALPDVIQWVVGSCFGNEQDAALQWGFAPVRNKAGSPRGYSRALNQLLRVCTGPGLRLRLMVVSRIPVPGPSAAGKLRAPCVHRGTHSFCPLMRAECFFPFS